MNLNVRRRRFSSRLLSCALVCAVQSTVLAAQSVPGEIVVYLRAFDQLARLAVYGAEARSLISRAISDLS